MKSKNSATILFLLFLASLGILNTIQPVNAGTVYTTVETLSDRDTYTNSTAPDTNYGSSDNFYIGATDETYPIFIGLFHFNYTNKPISFLKAEIVLEFRNILYPLDLNDLFFTIATCSNNWNESEATYNNMPSVVELLVEGYTLELVDQFEFHIILDVTDHILGSEGISIFAANAWLNYSLPGYTKESEFPQLGPKLVFTYEPIYPSTSSIVINNNEAYTNDPLIDLTLSCNDATEMCFRNETTGSWSAWEPYSTTKQLHLSGTTSNTKYSIYVKFRNSEGESAVIRDSIVYATTSPGDSTIPGFSLLITVSCLVIISLIFYKKKFKS